MSRFASPLRYPGGKANLTELLAEVIARNGLNGCVYAEPYAGGAGAALGLLFSERVSEILINDADTRIAAFWESILRLPERFAALVRDTPLTVDEWHRQRAVYARPSRHSRLKVGFAAFFLNRCNRSGILVNGGPIGGFDQTGRWKIDARFNRAELVERIEKIVAYRDRISVSSRDARDFLSEVVLPLSSSRSVFVYLDPPYYGNGPKLYMNAYEDRDHKKMAGYIKRIRRFKWVMSYDNVPEISTYYSGMVRSPFDLSYTAYERRSGRELLIHPRSLEVPRPVNAWVRGRVAGQSEHHA